MSTREPGDELVSRLVDHVFALAGLFGEAGDAITAPEGLSAARWLVLGALRDAPLSPAEIARRRGLTRQSARESVARLEASGHVARTAGPDRRTFAVELTPAGRRALAAIEPRRAAWATATAAAAEIPLDELRAAGSVLARLRAAAAQTSAGA